MNDLSHYSKSLIENKSFEYLNEHRLLGLFYQDRDYYLQLHRNTLSIEMAFIKG